MDIALLKIDANTPIHHLWKFDSVKIGEWVLAVGNPYNLTSTVTAGIVSAKARDLGTRNSILYSNRRSGKPRKQRRQQDLIGITHDFP
jgi:S1-C subfamily serine protease